MKICKVIIIGSTHTGENVPFKEIQDGNKLMFENFIFNLNLDVVIICVC